MTETEVKEAASKWVNKNYPYASFEVQDAAQDSFIKGANFILNYQKNNAHGWEKLKLPEGMFKK